MLVIGRESDVQGSIRLHDFDHPGRGLYDPELTRIRSDWRDPIGTSTMETRAFPDVRWMEISSVLRRELAAGRSPEQIKQIEFVGEPLDLASIERWRNRIMRDGWRP
jgi:hypothetical protein